MPHIDDFWDDIVDDGLVDPDQGGRARARFIQVGGGLDTAVLESAQLDAAARQTLLEAAAAALGRTLAGPTALAEPDREAARHIPRTIIDRYGVMPGRDESGRVILITPPLAPHVFNELKSRLGRSFDARIALEMDIRLALARHFDIPLPSRFEVLRSGRQPGRSALSGVPARRPVPKPQAVASLMPAPAAPSAPTASAPSGNPLRSWLSEASGKLRHAREREQLYALLHEAGASALDGRFYLLVVGDERIQCVAGTGLPRGDGPSIALHRGSRLDHALRIGSSRLEDWSHDADLTALYTALGRSRPARVMIEPIRDGLEVVGVFVGDHGRAGIDRGVVGDLRRWLSRISTRLADLRDSRAPEPQPPVAEPPRVSASPSAPSPPPRGPSSQPPADPFAAPTAAPTRRRRRPKLDLQELAEAARTAQATADALPAIGTEDALLAPPPMIEATEPGPPPPPAPPPVAAAPPTPEPPTPEPLAPAQRPAEPSPVTRDPGLPFAIDDDDPLAGFLSDPEIEAVADAIVAEVPDRLDAPAASAARVDGAREMGAPPNTMPSRPRAMPEAAPVASLFESVLPRTDAADEQAADQGVPPPTRPARPSAGRDGDARQVEPSPARGDDRPGPTINLRGPEIDAQRRRRPTAESSPRPADRSVDDLIEEARALGQNRVQAPPSDPPPRPSPIKARSTIDLKGEIEDEPIGDPPPSDADADDPARSVRKTVNLRRATSTPPPRPSAVLELDDDDVLEVTEEASATIDPTDVADQIEADEPLPPSRLSPEVEALKARRELEEADTGVFTIVGDPVEADAPDTFEADAALAEAETVELPEAVVDDLDVAAGTADVEPAPDSPSSQTPQAEAPPVEPDAADAPADAGAIATPDAHAPADAPEETEAEAAGVDAEPDAAPAPEAAEPEAPVEPDAAEPEPDAVEAPAEESPEEPEAELGEDPPALDEEADGIAETLPLDVPVEPDDAASPDADAPGADAEPPTGSAQPSAPPATAQAPESTDDAGPSAPPPAAEPPRDHSVSDPPIALDDLFGSDDAVPPPAPPSDQPSSPPDPVKDLFGPSHDRVADAPAELPDGQPSKPPASVDLFDLPAAEPEPPPGGVRAEVELSGPPIPIDDVPEPPSGGARAEVELSGPPIPIDDVPDVAPAGPFASGSASEPPDELLDLFEPPDDELSELDLVLSPPPVAQPSPTFEVIGALDLDGAADAGADFDLDLGLEPATPPEPAAEAEPPASDESEAPVDPAVLAGALSALTGGDAEAAKEAEETLVAAGEAALPGLFAIFPGPLVIDRYAAGDLVPVGQHGPVLRAICRIGTGAGPYLAERCTHLAPDVRYYAVYAFSAVRESGSLAAITPALTDKDPTVRAIACRVADSYRGDEIFGVLVAHLVNIVEKGRLADRRLAAEALGALHATDGATPLIAMLGAPQPPLRDAAHKALVEIARQDFGEDVWRWRTFFERSGDRPRIEWLLDGLLSDRRGIRVGSFRELKRVTHQNYGYTPDAPPATRRASAERWVRWWQQAGRSKFGHYR